MNDPMKNPVIKHEAVRASTSLNMDVSFGSAGTGVSLVTREGETPEIGEDGISGFAMMGVGVGSADTVDGDGGTSLAGEGGDGRSLSVWIDLEAMTLRLSVEVVEAVPQSSDLTVGDPGMDEDGDWHGGVSKGAIIRSLAFLS